jgi:ATP-dependent Clp protease ATP-binding subunit ClpA
MNADLCSRFNQGGSTLSSEIRTYDANHLIEKIKKKIIDQDVLVETAVLAMSERLAQKKRKGPLFSVLIVGPPATSKTAFGHALACEYFGSSEAIYDVPCVFLANNISGLLGTPPGWCGREGMLTTAVKNRP